MVTLQIRFTLEPKGSHSLLLIPINIYQNSYFNEDYRTKGNQTIVFLRNGRTHYQESWLKERCLQQSIFCSSLSSEIQIYFSSHPLIPSQSHENIFYIFQGEDGQLFIQGEEDGGHVLHPAQLQERVQLIIFSWSTSYLKKQSLQVYNVYKYIVKLTDIGGCIHTQNVL